MSEPEARVAGGRAAGELAAIPHAGAVSYTHRETIAILACILLDRCQLEFETKPSFTRCCLVMLVISLCPVFQARVPKYHWITRLRLALGN